MDTLSARKNRVWEIDALRGLCIPGMILIHLIYDVVNLYRFVDWPYPLWYSLFKNNYGALFILISGISVTLGSRSIRRGITVFLCGMLCTAVTAGMYLLQIAGRGIIIYFGVLHCLGVCMMIWPVFKKLPASFLAVLGLILVFAGLLLRGMVFDTCWLLIFGFQFPGFASSDYFPLMPNLGYFLLGAAFGRRFYPEKRSLLPNVNQNHPVIRFLCFCGRRSLWIYLLHQPVLALLCEIIALWKG